MALHNQEMNLVLSSDAKPRLKWTPQLHRRFVDAVKQLGGAEKATPKSLMRVMGIQGLTLYHLKSHLQKYRLGRSQQTFHHEKQEESRENERSDRTSKKSNGEEEKRNDVQVGEALKMQMEVQRKLHEQIEVQRHLQLRMEAQGRYLQSVLKKAEETLSGYRACSIEAQRARAQLASILFKDKDIKGSSLDSSLTSSDTSHHNSNSNSKTNIEIPNMMPMADIDLNRDSLNEFDSGPTGIDLNSHGFAATSYSQSLH